MKSPIIWVGGKGKLLWLIQTLSPCGYSRFIDVFGGSATVTLNHPKDGDCSLEVYNDYNSDLTNLFSCIKERPLALLRELGFLPLTSRDEFNVLHRFFTQAEFTEEYMREELALADRYLDEPEKDSIRSLLLERAALGDVRRAAAYFKLIRYSFSGTGKSFGGKGCDIRRFFYLIWECSRRLSEVVIENKDFADLLSQYDRGDSFFYCDPPYFEAERHYAVEFPQEDHIRLHDTLRRAEGFVMVSYNDCPFICDLYQDFYIYRTERPNSMSHKAGDEYAEVIMTNYDPRIWAARSRQMQFDFGMAADRSTDHEYRLIHQPDRALKA